MNTEKSVLSNFLWRVLEQVGARGIVLLVTVILARLIAPEAYGAVALMTVLITILQVFVDSGLGSALIQKKDADDLDFSSVFYFNLAACALLYLLIFLAAPLIAGYYEDPGLVPLIRVLSLTVLISGVKNIQQAYVSRTMQFKRFFFATLGGTAGAAAIGVWLAWEGCGAWALVAQQVLNTAVDTVILWFTVRWRPKRAFSLQRLKKLYAFGWKLLARALLDTVYSQVYQLVIGKKYSKSDLGYYNRGLQFPQFIVTNVDVSIASVLFPVMSQAQDQKERLRAMTRRAIMTSTYVMAPLMMGLAFTGEPLIRVILTEKWLPALPYLRIFCVSYTFYPIYTANANAMQAMGRSGLLLKLEFMKKAVGFALLAACMWHGPLLLAYSALASSVLSYAISSWPNRKLLDYGFLRQMKDISANILLAVFMGICIHLLSFLKLPDIPRLALQIVCGAAIYIGISAGFHFESFAFAKSAAGALLARKTDR